VTEIVTLPGLLQLSDQVLVSPPDVAAVTQDPDSPETTRVYLRGAGTSWIPVEREFHEVATALAQALTPPRPVGTLSVRCPSSALDVLRAHQKLEHQRPGQC